MTLNPGEILYLPARWSHFVVNLDIAVMVNFWHEPSPLVRLRSRARNVAWRIHRGIGRG